MVTAARAAALALATVVAFAAAASAAADGEAGLVVQHGDGTVETFCIAFTGNGINGDDLLRRAGVTFEQLSGLVCAVGPDPSEGCRGATSLESCTCRCRPGSSECVYWSYFTRRYGQSWVYSAVGFTGQVSRDGELQAWRWGKGGPTSAPAPVDVTFEQVCGHPPGLAAATAAATAVTVLPTPTNPAVPTVPGTAPGTTATAATQPIVTLTRPPDATVTLKPAPAAETTAIPGSTTAAPGTAGDTRDGPSSLLAFGVVAGFLVAAAAAALAWRAHRDR